MDLLHNITQGDTKSLSRAISLVENYVEGYREFMQSLPPLTNNNVIGITGPPGAGKSTVTDALIRKYVLQGKRVAVLCIDPSSPFNYGAILGDRIRMNEWYNHKDVFIRSLATRGSLGGLHPKIIEIADIIKSAGYDRLIIETVGVGQSEVEIVGVADTTVVVLIPEGGDEIQTMKAGIMEIADIFVVNKADRPDAETFIKNLKMMLAPAFHSHKEIPILKTIATNNSGIDLLLTAIENQLSTLSGNDKKIWLLTQKAYILIQAKKMNSISLQNLYDKISDEIKVPDFNLYKFVDRF